MMKNSTIENLLLLLLICVIPRKSFGATIVTTEDDDTTATVSSVAATVNSGISLLKDMMENIQRMDKATSARLDGIIMNLDEVRALPYNSSHIKQEVLENLYGTQTRLARLQNTLKGLATELKSGCEDLIMIYNYNSEDNSVELLHYFAGKMVKLGSAVEKTLKHADSLISETIQEVFPKNTEVFKVYEEDIQIIKKELKKRKKELEEIETIQASTSPSITDVATTVTVAGIAESATNEHATATITVAAVEAVDVNSDAAAPEAVTTEPAAATITVAAVESVDVNSDAAAPEAVTNEPATATITVAAVEAVDVNFDAASPEAVTTEPATATINVIVIEAVDLNSTDANPCISTTDLSACDAYKDNIIQEIARLNATITEENDNITITDQNTDNNITNAMQEIARLTDEIAAINDNITIIRQNAKAEMARANAAIENADKKFAEANRRAEVAAAMLDEIVEANAAAADARTKAANANAYARVKDELNLANQNLKIMHNLKEKIYGLVVANTQLSSYVKNDISLIDDWKTKLQATLSDHKNRITLEDIKWNIEIIKNLKVLIKTCDNYLIQV